ncbi:phosphatase domain-containing protein [Roseospira visakhapatnamensis]|uniref:Phosphatidate phosphatase APP1 n=1 Tax=Roseospira visakhapatnamensis TaxID=390880 RepID=A0A7W6RAF0_9PROT|nr:phosphatase domain-containing protein [Roseospira visakhapatnamensis]MBB4264878.1 phosphatidate phosphatase APP1 [Roseospira visakhapatnamensis]
MSRLRARIARARIANARIGERVSIRPYRGTASAQGLFLMARVLAEPSWGPLSSRDPHGLDPADLGRHLVRRGVPGAVVRASFQDQTQDVVTDADGYVRVRLCPDRPPPSGWNAVELLLARSTFGSARARGQVWVPPASARHLVISDIDDTVLFTGVANRAAMLWRLFVAGADHRRAFTGVARLYQALRDGGAGGGAAPAENPVVFVSRGPWGVYDVLEEVFRRNGISAALGGDPVVMLREWGLTMQTPLPRRAPGHKRALIEAMMAVHPTLPVVLVGDNGQRDPETYAAVARDHPRRVAAILIRDVAGRPPSRRAPARWQAWMDHLGVPVLVAADSDSLRRRAAMLGLAPADPSPA